MSQSCDSFYNGGSTLAENIRYLMYKYDISIDDWDQPLSYVVSKVFKYNTDHIIIDNVSVATDIHVRPLPSAHSTKQSIQCSGN